LLLPSWLLPLNLDVFDLRVRWATITPADNALHCCLWPFEHRLDTPIVEVAHPPADAADARLLARIGAEINPLHAPIDQNVRPHSLHNRNSLDCELRQAMLISPVAPNYSRE
jgi:hypothetical protein